MNFELGIFYPEYGGYYTGTINNYYYFAAPVDIGQSVLQWGNNNDTILSNVISYLYSSFLTDDGNSGYDGNYNTKNVLNCEDYPAGNFCNLLEIKSPIQFNDYFLPSVHELNMIFKNKISFNLRCPIAEKWINDYYWSSSQFNFEKAWYVNFVNGYSYNTIAHKHKSLYVRAIRKISIKNLDFNFQK
jgi:hypothetical protein